MFVDISNIFEIILYINDVMMGGICQKMTWWQGCGSKIGQKKDAAIYVKPLSLNPLRIGIGKNK